VFYGGNAGCECDDDVVLYSIEGGERYWPGGVGQGGINAKDLISAFFEDRR